MPTLDVDGLTFTFPDGWQVSIYDRWAFYRNQFSQVREGLKAVDVLALETQMATLWLIEVKDYRRSARTKQIDLAREVAAKAADTLACLTPAAVRATRAEERLLADKARRCREIRLVLHLESAPRCSRLFDPTLDRANLKQKLRERVKAIDPHPVVADRQSMGNLPWQVS